MAAWQRLRALLDELRAWEWPEAFGNPSGDIVLDGSWWHVHIDWNDVEVRSSGENSYPPDGVGPEPSKEFERLCEAISELLGGKRFG